MTLLLLAYLSGVLTIVSPCILPERGAIQETNFDGYGILRINEMPPVETIVMSSGGFWGGVGEPPVVVAGPAVMNALFAATGQRIRTQPLKNHDLIKA